MKFFTKQEKLLVILLSLGLLSGIGLKYFKGGFDKEEIEIELIDVDENIVQYYEELNQPQENKNYSEKININSADQTELTKLTGVGPALAKRIIEKRQEIGNFNSVEDLKLVKGIGVKLLQKNIEIISIEED